MNRLVAPQNEIRVWTTLRLSDTSLIDMEKSAETQSQALAAALREGLERYIQTRKERVPRFIDQALSLQNCIKVQGRHFLKDLALNPVNTLWAIPYISIRKVLEAGEKLGWEGANLMLPTIPRSARTDFQKEMERLIQVELFGLPTDGAAQSELAKALEHQDGFRGFYASTEWRDLKAQSESDVRHAVTEYCNTQNGFNDLGCSTAILICAQYFFGDRSLDLFAMGRRWAALWRHQEAVKQFPLGHKLGRFFYKVVPPPPPTSNQVYLATGIALGLLAVFSTLINIFGFPARTALGFQTAQLAKLIQNVEDKILLRLTKSKILLSELKAEKISFGSGVPETSPMVGIADLT